MGAMTLVALGPGGERLDLDQWSDDEWHAFRREPVPASCEGCGGPMHTKAIPIDRPLPGEPAELRIFAHNPGVAQRCRQLGYDGSPSHDRLKRRIAHGARRAGWTTQYEVQSSPTCRTDVLATNPRTGKTRALEAQLAGLTTADALDRHARYVADFGDCTWVHSGRREWSSQIPSLKVNQEHDLVVSGILVDLSDGVEAPPTPVEDVVGDVLTNMILWVYASDWGTYVLRDALSRQAPTRPPGRASRRGVKGATRFCGRIQAVDPGIRVLAKFGFAGASDFRLRCAMRTRPSGSWATRRGPTAIVTPSPSPMKRHASRIPLWRSISQTTRSWWDDVPAFRERWPIRGGVARSLGLIQR